MYHRIFYPLFYWRALGLFPYLGYCKYNAEMNIEVHISFWNRVLGFFKYIPQVESLGHKAVPFLIFWGISIQFPLVAAPICIPTNSALRFPFPYILANHCLLVYWLWPFWQEWGDNHIVVLICISLMLIDIAHLFICLLAIYMCSLEELDSSTFMIHMKYNSTCQE